MVNCAIFGCSNKAGSKRGKLRFFKVPAAIKNQCEKTKLLSEERRRLWLSRISRKEITSKTAKRYTSVCSLHFVSGAPSKLFENTSPDWAPSLHLGYESKDGKKASSIGVKRHLRATEREKKKRKTEDFQEVIEDEVDFERHKDDMRDESVTDYMSTSCMTNISGLDILNLYREINHLKSKVENCEMNKSKIMDDNIALSMKLKNDNFKAKNDIEALAAEVKKLKEEKAQLAIENFGLKKELENRTLKISQLTSDNIALRIEKKNLAVALAEGKLDENGFENNDKKVKFYTGLPNWCRLKDIFDFVTKRSKEMFQAVNHSLSPFQEFLVVLMRLRLNLFEQDLAYRFGVSQPTISKTISNWLPFLTKRLNIFVVWPKRDELVETMPKQFRKSFGDNVSVVIDCFEVFIDRPSSLSPRASTYSQYKHHNTVKFLMGITPQGTVSFISRAWVGRTSDKEVTDKCGVLENLKTGDIVLADRGFNIEESVAKYSARLHIPAFRKGKDQLSCEDVTLTRKVANVRIHVERVIGLVRRKYTILRGTLPIETLTPRKGEKEAPINQIVLVCSALTNLCGGIVNLE